MRTRVGIDVSCASRWRCARPISCLQAGGKPPQRRAIRLQVLQHLADRHSQKARSPRGARRRIRTATRAHGYMRRAHRRRAGDECAETDHASAVSHGSVSAVRKARRTVEEPPTREQPTRRRRACRLPRAPPPSQESRIAASAIAIDAHQAPSRRSARPRRR